MTEIDGQVLSDRGTEDLRDLDTIKAEIAKAIPSTSRIIAEKVVLAALGSIPWVGGFISAAASIKSDKDGKKINTLQTQWLEEHSFKIQNLMLALESIVTRLEKLGGEIDERIQSEEYLNLVRQSFHAWDKAATSEKRSYIANLITNAAGTRLCSDDVVRLFIDWLNSYHESYFSVIREVYKNPGIDRYSIWVNIYGDTALPKENSAEADLYKLLIRDLSTGGVIRQERETNQRGQFIRSGRTSRKNPVSVLESAFEDSKSYVLTELGKQFVHYSMNEIVDRIGTGE